MVVRSRISEKSCLASQPRVTVAKARKRLWKSEEGECPPLEAVTRRRVKAQEEYKIQVCALENCNG
jgi:hypothetical protein